MPDIFHDLPIRSKSDAVFEAITSPDGLNAWWTKDAAGEPAAGATYRLYFGPGYDWRARVIEVCPNSEIAWRLEGADREWVDTIVRFVLRESNGATEIRFSHTAWREPGDHFRISSYCWAMYLRLLKRYVEYEEIVPYERRLVA